MAGETYINLANYIKDVLSTVSGIGQIYTVPKNILEIEDFQGMATTGIGDTKNINFWIIQRTGVKNLRRAGIENYGMERREHEFVVTGYYGVNEANNTELSFQNILNSISDAWNGRVTQGPTTSPVIEYTSPVEITNITHDKLGNLGYLVHVCNIIIRMQERIEAVTYQ